MRKVQIFWSPLSVTPILSSCLDVEPPPGSASIASEVAVLLILSFEPHLTFSSEMAFLVVLLSFCFSLNHYFLLLKRYLD